MLKRLSTARLRSRRYSPIESYVSTSAAAMCESDEFPEQNVRQHRMVSAVTLAPSSTSKLTWVTVRSYRCFPSDEEFKRDLGRLETSTGSENTSTWLRRLENHGSVKNVCLSAGVQRSFIFSRKTRIYPKDGLQDLGPEWKRVQERWFHTLGNLTRTGYEHLVE